jgi:hypothetical protein
MTGRPDVPDWEELYTGTFPRVYRAVLATVRDREVAKDAEYVFHLGIAPVGVIVGAYLLRAREGRAV